MNLPFALPDWLPWWALLLALIPAAIYLLLVLAMPFNVFGLKDRLDLLDARLDEIQAELRQLTLPPASARAAEPEAYYVPPPAPPQPERPQRAEPRFDWPR